MNFTALKAAVSARGFSYLTDAQLGVLVNDAMHELDDLEQWPYLEAGVTGTAPVTVSDLGAVQAVLDTSNNTVLERADWTDLLTMFGEDLSTTGAPEYWYVAWPSGTPEVATYPTSTATIGIQYYKVASDLSSGSDTPLAPARFHGIIIDLAVQAAYRDSDDQGQAEQLQVQIDRRLNGMRTALLTDQGPRFVQILNASDA